MKKIKIFAIVSGFLMGSIQLYGQGYIIPNGVTYAGALWSSGGGVNAVFNPTNLATTFFTFYKHGETQPTDYVNTFQFGSRLDGKVRCFFVTSNTPISLQPIMSGLWTELVYNQAGYVFDDGVPFYLALYTGDQTTTPTSGLYTDPLYGWVQLVNNQGVIQMLGGAIEYGGAGIIAGTQIVIQAVPEPSTLVLLGLGAAGLGWRLRKRD